MHLRPLASGALVVAVLLASTLGFVWALSAEYDETPTETYETLDEQLTADAGNWTATDSPNYTLSWLDNETVRDADGNVLTEGTDYEWSTTNGSVYIYSGSTEVADGEQISVDYYYRAKIPTARNLRALFSVGAELVLPFSILIAVAVAIAGFAIAIVKWSPLGASRSRTRNFGR